MLNKIKRLGADTAVYGISTILGRFLNFLLVPFYTNVLPPGDYGVVAYVYSLIAFLNIVYTYGMESAYFKYSSTGEIGTSRQNYSTPFVSLFATSALLSAAILLFAPAVAQGITPSRPEEDLVRYAAWMLFFDTLSVIPFASLRMERKAWTFASLKSINIIVNVAANLILLLVFHMGVAGIFISGVLASAVTFVLLIPNVIRHFTPVFNKELFKALLKFGLPYLPAGLASMMIQVVDRPVLRMLTDDATVGIYQANYRLGIFMMLIVSMFDFAWRPFFLSSANEPDARRLFARVLSYFVLAAAGIFLLLSFFIPDFVAIRIFGRYIIHPDYWSGLSIVPVVLMGYLFLGIYNNLVAGVYIEKKTQYLPAITISGAIVNVVANFVLIPMLGIMGAAIATFLSYAIMATIMYIVAQRIYPVPYELDRLLKIAVACIAAYVPSLFLPRGIWGIVEKLGLLALYGVLIYAMKFFAGDELGSVRTLLSRLGLLRSKPSSYES